MGAEIITTDQTAQYVIDSGDFVVLMPDVSLTIAATTDPGFIAGNAGNFTVTVHGQVVTKGKAAVLGLAAGDLPLAGLSVSDTGLLQALTDTAVEIRRSNNAIDNDGTITGGAGGIKYAAGVTGGSLANSGTISSLQGAGILADGGAGGAAPGLFEIVNTGSIEGATVAVSVAYEHLALTNHGEIISLGTGILVADDPGLLNVLTLVNTGLIQGDGIAIDATEHDDHVTNIGTLVGTLLLGGGANTFDNAGTTTGEVGMGAGADRVTNTGAVTGALDLGAGANVATNAGKLASVTAGSGDDRFTNALTGVVTGVLALGDGNNDLANHGQIEAGLTFGSGDDTLLNAGTITGDLSLGEGSNVATITGALFGALSGGDSADIVVVEGRIVGDVSLGGGADRLTCDGRIDGDVDLGTGADILRLGDTARRATGTFDGGSGEDTLRTWIDVEDVFEFEVIALKGSAGLSVTADAIANTVYGNSGANDIDGGDGDDTLFGRLGGDTLQGGLGADTLYGGGGQDELIGGAGADVMDGGRGSDTFTYETVADSTASAADRILDFQRGRDVIDLAELVAGEVTWLGKDRFTAGGSAEVRFRSLGNDVVVRIDADGDGGLDMVILVEDVSKLAAGDFIL